MKYFFIFLVLSCSLLKGQYFDQEFGDEGIVVLNDVKNAHVTDVIADVDGNLYVSYYRTERDGFSSAGNTYHYTDLVKYNKIGERVKNFGKRGKVTRKIYETNRKDGRVRYVLSRGLIFSYPSQYLEKGVVVHDLDGNEKQKFSIEGIDKLMGCLLTNEGYLLSVTYKGKVVVVDEHDNVILEEQMPDLNCYNLKETDTGFHIRCKDLLDESKVNVYEAQFSDDELSYNSYRVRPDSTSIHFRVIGANSNYLFYNQNEDVFVSSYKDLDLKWEVPHPGPPYLNGSLEWIPELQQYFIIYPNRLYKEDVVESGINELLEVNFIYGLINKDGKLDTDFDRNGYLKDPLNGNIQFGYLVSAKSDYVYLQSQFTRSDCFITHPFLM